MCSEVGFCPLWIRGRRKREMIERIEIVGTRRGLGLGVPQLK